jgi:hypothetical protein
MYKLIIFLRKETKLKTLSTVLFAAALATSTSAFAVNILVAPTTGVSGSNPTNSIADAITQVNAGADTNNTITLRSTEGIHTLPANTNWAINSGKNLSIVAENGQPIVKLTQSSGQFMLKITPGTTNSVSVNGVAFIPQTGLSWGNNSADAFQLNPSGGYTFSNCVFSPNDGSDGVKSQDASAAFVEGSGNIGDDWLQVVGQTDLTLDHCAVSGGDDAIVVVTASAATRTVKLQNGTVIANTGGCAVQVASSNCAVVLDGSAARVLLAKNGQSTVSAGSDVGIKFFWDGGCSLTATKADIVGASLGGITDFEGVYDGINLTDCRIALNNSIGDTGPAGGDNFLIDDGSNDDTGVNEAVNITRCTFHDALGTANPNSFFVGDGASEPTVNFVIQDSIFSGSGDTFKLLNSGGVTNTVNKTFTAVVTSGSHAVGSVGDLGAGDVSADPGYVSTAYSIGLSQTNPDFLLPASSAYQFASSNGGRLTGGAPGVVSNVSDWAIY